jgi:alanine dehydrogenase
LKIGVVKEIKEHEYRVALTPAGVDELIKHGHEVLVQVSAGEGSGLEDALYEAAGGRLLPDAAAVFGEAEMILKVKEPLAPEWELMRPRQILFTYFHLAADRELTDAVVGSGSSCFAYETLHFAEGLAFPAPIASRIDGRHNVRKRRKRLANVEGRRLRR